MTVIGKVWSVHAFSLSLSGGGSSTTTNNNNNNNNTTTNDANTTTANESKFLVTKMRWDYFDFPGTISSSIVACDLVFPPWIFE